MKAFRLNEYEWWAGRDLEEAVAAAMKATGLPREEVVDDEFAGEDPATPFFEHEDSGAETSRPIGQVAAEMTQPGYIGGIE